MIKKTNKKILVLAIVCAFFANLMIFGAFQFEQKSQRESATLIELNSDHIPEAEVSIIIYFAKKAKKFIVLHS